VKEKGLRAGDVISFHRMAGPDKRLFIDWKLRRVNAFAVDAMDGPPVKGAIRLFGVNLVMRTDASVNTEKVEESSLLKDPEYSLKRSRGMENASLVTKKQRMCRGLV